MSLVAALTTFVIAASIKPTGGQNRGSEDVHLRLVGQDEQERATNGTGVRPKVGRVETNATGEWRPICSYKFDRPDADVVCNGLGYKNHTSFWTTMGRRNSFKFTAVRGSATISGLQCLGNETSIVDCPMTAFGRVYCSASNKVVVACLTKSDVQLRLIAENKTNSNELVRKGRLEIIIGGIWGTVCYDEFSRADAKVVCRQLGFEFKDVRLIRKRESEKFVKPIWFGGFGCSGSESNIWQCPIARTLGHNGCDHSNDVHMECRESDNSTCSFGEYLDDEKNCVACDLGYKCIKSEKVTCPPGFYQDEVGQEYCKQCQPGAHQSESGSIDCVPCPRGLFCNTTTQAHKCPPGTYQPLYSAVACLPCPFGQYQPMEASTECLVCPPGKMCPLGSVDPVDCLPGTFQTFSGMGICETCALHHYQVANASTEPCEPCPSGHSCHVASAPPVQCKAGTATWNHDSRECEFCPAGMYQDEPGRNSCKQCPPGHRCPRGGTSSPLQCDFGWHQPLPGQSQCFRCTNGAYTLNRGQKECYPCPKGFNCKNRRSPMRCEPGTYNDGSSSSCKRCGLGFCQPLSQQGNCIKCPKGHFCSSYYKNADPTPCSKGSYQYLEWQSQCNACPKGHYCPNEKLVSPLPCKPGQIQPAEGRTNCELCPENTFQLRHAATHCHPCPSAHVCPTPTERPRRIQQGGNEQVAVINKCPPGYYLKPRTGTEKRLCTPCQTGYYQTKNNAVECIRCPEGHTCEDSSRKPKPCPVGFYRSHYQNLCTRCSARRYAETAGSSKCKTCPAGYECLPGSSVPAACPPGTYSSWSKKCTPCSRGKYQPHYSSTQCISCTIGHFCPEGSTKPLPCPRGTLRVSYNGRYCEQCPRGSKCPNIGMIKAITCPPGTYQPKSAQSQCLPCPTGYYQENYGATHCSQCPSGSFCAEADKAPVPCPKNHYQNLYGSDTCKKCPKLRYQPNVGGRSCIQCPAGYECPFLLKKVTVKKVNNGQTEETSTSLDEAAKSKTGNTGQQLENSDNDEEEQQKNKNNQQEREKEDKEDSFTPVPCPPGHFSRSGDGICSPCRPGHFASATASSSCEASPDGTYTPGEGNTKPYLCPNGYAVNCHAEPGCNKCPKGRNSGSGMRSCKFPSEKDKEKEKCKRRTLDCAKKQAKCVMDSVLNAATAGAWTYIDIAYTVGNELAKAKWGTKGFAGQVQKDIENAALIAEAALVSVSPKLPNLEKYGQGQEAGRAGARVKTAIRIFNGLKKLKELGRNLDSLADKSRQDSVDMAEVGYESIKTIKDVLDAIDFDRLNNKIKSRAELNKFDKLKKQLKPLNRLKTKINKNLQVPIGKTLSKKLLRKAGRKIPILCNVIESFSKDCRTMWSWFFGNKKCDKRKKRSLLQHNENITALANFIALLSPYIDYFQKHPDIYLFMTTSEPQCKEKFLQSYSRDSGDKSMFISENELEQLKPLCANSTEEWFFDVESIVHQFNQSFQQLSKGNYAGSILEDMANEWALASDALEQDFVWKNQSDLELQAIANDTIEDVEKILNNTKVAIGTLFSVEHSPYGPKGLLLYVLVPNVTREFSGDLLTQFKLPEMKSGEKCEYRGITTPPSGTSAAEIQAIEFDSFPGEVFVPDSVEKRPIYVLACKKPE